MNRHYAFITFLFFCNQQVQHVQYTPTHVKTQNFVETIIKRQYADPPINIRRIPPAIDGWSNYTEAEATGGFSSLSEHIPAIDAPSEASPQSPTEETTTIDPNLSQQNQKSPKKEGKFKTALKKLYTEGKTILGSVKNGLNKIYNSKIFQRGKDVAGKGVKRVLGSEVVNSLKKEAIEQTKDLTKNFGKQMINKGAAIITASVNAAGKINQDPKYIQKMNIVLCEY